MKNDQMRWGCSECGWIFETGILKPAVNLSETGEEALQREFNDHVCASFPKKKPREDFSQAAARIVREATEKI